MLKKIIFGLISTIVVLAIVLLAYEKIYDFNKIEKVFVCEGTVAETGRKETRAFSYTLAFGSIEYVNANGDYYDNYDNIYFSDNLIGIMHNYQYSVRAVKFDRILKELEMITRPKEKDGYIETFTGICNLTTRG